MSGSFNDLDVVPTLVSFAVATGSVDDIISPELKNKGSKLILIDISKDKYAGLCRCKRDLCEST